MQTPHDILGQPWWKRLDLLTLLAAAVVVGGAFAFLELLDVVREHEVARFDDAILTAVGKYHASPLLLDVGRDVTALGGMTVLGLLTLVVASYVWLIRRYRVLLVLLIAIGGGQLLNLVLKGLIARPRPEIFPHRAYVMTSSFPSGHAMMSAIVYLTLGTICARVTDQQKLKLFYVFVALFMTGIVGASRVFMGVHYPTDVLAGWTAGLMWAVACWWTARWLEHRARKAA
jgi:undecaprenyl-diphosphatase